MTHPAGQPTVRSSAAPGKVRAGMGDVVADFVEIYSDEDYARATGMLSLLGPDGRLVAQTGGSAGGTAVPALDPATWLRLYRGMLLLRLLDQRLTTLQKEGRISFYAEARGQEATVVAPLATLDPSDWVVPSHREGAAAIYRGLPVRSYVAQLFGTTKTVHEGGPSPVHPGAAHGLRFLPPSSCPATQLPQAAGIAWAAKIKGDKTVVLAYLGEGATSAEDFHTGVNFAAVFKVPVVFICVNNGWSVSTPAAAQSASETFAVKALAYGMPGVRVDGNDALAMYAATREAVDRARAGGGPTLIEGVTYRMGGHDAADEPERYRPPGEIERWAARDPLPRLRDWLKGGGVLDDAAEARLRHEVEKEISDAIAANEGLPPPTLRTLIEDVYVHPPRALEEQLAELERVRASRGR